MELHDIDRFVVAYEKSSPSAQSTYQGGRGGDGGE